VIVAVPAEFGRLLTAAEAGELLGLTPRQVREAEWRGHLPAVRIGRLVRFPLADLERMVRESVTRARSRRERRQQPDGR